MIGMPYRPPRGTRVRLTHDVDRYPHFIAPKGATGTVVYEDAHMWNVRMDALIPGAEEWENEVHWYPENGNEPLRDVEIIDMSVHAARRRP